MKPAKTFTVRHAFINELIDVHVQSVIPEEEMADPISTRDQVGFPQDNPKTGEQK